MFVYFLHIPSATRRLKNFCTTSYWGLNKHAQNGSGANVREIQGCMPSIFINETPSSLSTSSHHISALRVWNKCSCEAVIYCSLVQSNTTLLAICGQVASLTASRVGLIKLRIIVAFWLKHSLWSDLIEHLILKFSRGSIPLAGAWLYIDHHHECTSQK